MKRYKLSAGEGAVGKLEDATAGLPGGSGEFRCVASYPSAKRSLQLGRQNLHLFRLKNTRFDFIGGGLYFLIVVRCRFLPPQWACARCVAVGNPCTEGAWEWTRSLLIFLAAKMDTSRAVSVL